MKKIKVKIDDKKVKFASSGSTPIRYKAQFQRDFFKDIFELGKLEGIEANATMKQLQKINFDTLYNLVWVLAKNADKDIPEPEEWLLSFDEFDLFKILPQVQDLLSDSLQTTKKKK